MIKRLRKQGNGQVLPIDKSTMEAMGVGMETPLQVTVTGNTLVVTPVHVGVAKDRLDASVKKMRKRYGKTLENLAK
jgi:antitoxin component of MazEF toxin-antitoxin module